MRAFRLAYDGRDYRGFQRQPDVPTVSGTVLGALRDLGVVDSDEVPSGYAAAGRTDAGVSAVAQTVAFEAPDWLDPAALNAELPADVRAWASEDVPADFHATHDAAAREYTYFLHARDADDDRARVAADALGGRRDYHNLTPDDEGTVRDLAIDVRREGPFLVVRVSADGFPRQLVRRLVSVLEAVATGAADEGRVERIFDDEPLSGPEGVPPAAPEPLVLTAVAYPDLDFVVDEEAAASARRVFEARRAAHRTAARVSRAIGGIPASTPGERQGLGDGEPTREP